MKLLTKAIEKQLAKYPIYSQDGKGGKAQVICKFFNPCGSQTWYILEGEKQDDDYILFALLDNMGEREYGYVFDNFFSRSLTGSFWVVVVLAIVCFLLLIIIRRTLLLLYPVPGGQFFVPRTLFGGRTGDKNTIKMRKQTRQSKKKRK